MSSIKEKKVRDFMHRGVITVRLEDSARKVARILADNKIHAVAIVTLKGETMGIISEIDIIKHIDEDIEKLTAEDIMSSHVKNITPAASVVEAANTMAQLGYHRLLIMGESPANQVAVGILSASDIVAGMARR